MYRRWPVHWLHRAPKSAHREPARADSPAARGPEQGAAARRPRASVRARPGSSNSPRGATGFDRESPRRARPRESPGRTPPAARRRDSPARWHGTSTATDRAARLRRADRPAPDREDHGRRAEWRRRRDRKTGSADRRWWICPRRSRRESRDRSGGYAKRQVVNDRLAGVPEGDAIEFDLAERGGQRKQLGPFDDFRLGIEQLPYARQRDAARDEIGIEAHQILHRREQPHVIGHDRHQGA